MLGSKPGFFNRGVTAADLIRLDLNFELKCIFIAHV